MATRVYQYGLLPPTTNAELIDDQIRGAHRYRNVLVEIERERRDAVRQILSSHPDVEPLEALLVELVKERDAARQVILVSRQKSRSRSETTADRAAVKTLNDRVRVARVEVKAAKQAIIADVQIQERLTAAEEHSRERVRKARGECGVYWGTYLLQEAAADQARGSRTPPSFVPYRGEGRVSVQLQGGLSLDELWGTDTQLQIGEMSTDPHVQRPWKPPARPLRLRIGSDAKRGPIWGVWPLIMHRPLPPGAIVKSATVSRRRKDCLGWEWRLDITITTDAVALARPVPAAGVVALNLGFCQRPDGGIRSGYVVGDDGAEQEITVGKSDLLRGRDLTPEQIARANSWVTNGVSKADSIRSIRDGNMNEMQAALSAWKAEQQEWHAALARRISCDRDSADRDSFFRVAMYIFEGGPCWPAWFHDRIQHVHVWKAQERFRALSTAWRKERERCEGRDIQGFSGDDRGFKLLEAWRRRDDHLDPYEAGLRRSALRDRKEGYRIIASRMAKQYRMLVIDDTDLHNFEATPPPESLALHLTVVNHNQRLAAASELRAAFVNAFGPARIFTASAVDVTRKCNACGVINTWDRLAAGRAHTCTGCGISWDQDANACRNLLREWSRAEADWETARSAKLANAKPSRSQRLRAARTAKPVAEGARD